LRFLLDSNAWIALFRQNSQALVQRLGQYAAADTALCSVVLGELWYGSFRSGIQNMANNDALIEQLRLHHQSLPFDDAAAREYARVRSDLAAAGQIIGPNDLMIAAIALANGLTLVTHNTAEVGRITGLTIEDWQNP
jgi:tRNA(fMet)-specific endonuclease VapC